jgi:pyruvate dehydrogenase E2 component (dihydrolipoamide acetyltransferase)
VAKSIDIVVPDLGDFENVEIIEVLVASGDKVEAEDGLITLETDKAAMDVPAPQAGTIEEISVAAGDTVSSGDVIGRMSADDGDQPTGETTVVAENVVAEKQAPQAEGKADGDDEAGATSGASGRGQTEVVPDIGDFEDVEIIEVHVAEGDEIEAEDPLVTLETDKAAMDVPATAAGTVSKVLVSVGDKVSAGSAIAEVDAAAGQSSGEAKPASDKEREAEQPQPERRGQPTPETGAEQAARQAPRQKPAAMPPVNETGFARAHASPSVRKLARELGVDLAAVKGSGAKNRVLHDDVKAFVKSILSGQSTPAGEGLPKTPSVDFAKFGATEMQPLTRIQKISGPRLQASWINLPHVTQHDLADITDLEARRQELKGSAKEKGISLTPLAFILKACVAALREFPRVNASLADDGENLVLKKYVHLGFAADTEQGLMVPVIRDADKKDVYELADELGRLSAAARDGKLKAADLQGASFTVSSLGGIGGTAFTPIVNAPEVGILGVSRASMQPVWDGEKFAPRLLLPLSFSYDHRVIDGAMAVRFTTFLAEALGDVEKLLEAIP